MASARRSPTPPGSPPGRTVQRLMRHSTLKLMGKYTKPRVADLDAAAEALPSLRPTSGPEAAAATGTDGPPPTLPILRPRKRIRNRLPTRRGQLGSRRVGFESRRDRRNAEGQRTQPLWGVRPWALMIATCRLRSEVRPAGFEPATF